MVVLKAGFGQDSYLLDHDQRPVVSVDRNRIGYPAGCLRFFWIRIGFGYLFLKKIGSGQDICLICIMKFS